MNNEIEIKVVLKNRNKVLRFLKKNAKKIADKAQKDIYFVMPNANFFEEKPVTRYLRVRSQGKEDCSFDYHVCHIDKQGNLLWTKEYEVGICDSNMLAQILKKLGLIDVVVVKKARAVFQFNKFKISVDQINKLGSFIEIEFSTKERVTKAKSEIIKKECYLVLETIGAKWEQAPKLGYPDLLLQRNKKA